MELPASLAGISTTNVISSTLPVSLDITQAAPLQSSVPLVNSPAFVTLGSQRTGNFWQTDTTTRMSDMLGQGTNTFVASVPQGISTRSGSTNNALLSSVSERTVEALAPVFDQSATQSQQFFRPMVYGSSDSLLQNGLVDDPTNTISTTSLPSTSSLPTTFVRQNILSGIRTMAGTSVLPDATRSVSVTTPSITLKTVRTSVLPPIVSTYSTNRLLPQPGSFYIIPRAIPGTRQSKKIGNTGKYVFPKYDKKHVLSEYDDFDDWLRFPLPDFENHFRRRITYLRRFRPAHKWHRSRKRRLFGHSGRHPTHEYERVHGRLSEQVA
ncbi:unnamed protein product [Dicrocoelium dendriticum]|nr:unnamed protein product [Dicrocoelium dendriticum]